MKKLLIKMSVLWIMLIGACIWKYQNINNIIDDNNSGEVIPDDPAGEGDSSVDDSGSDDGEDVIEPVPVVDYCALDSKVCINNAYVPGSEHSSLEEAYSETYKSVVTIMTYVDGDLVMSSGSGFIYSVSSDDKYTYIITNAHVINDHITIGGTMKAKYYEVLYHNNVRVSAELLAKDAVEDVAVLRAIKEPNNDFVVAKIGDDSTLRVGQMVYAIGSPYSQHHNNTLTSGVVSGLNVVVDSDNDGDGVNSRFYLTQIDAALSSGNSGGPLFNLKGEVVGVNTLKIDGTGSNTVLESMNFSLKINHVVNVANSILKNGVYSRPYIGIVAISVSEIGLVERANKGISNEILTGIFVDGVYAGSPAANIILKNTIITKINGIQVVSFSNFSAELLKYKKGDTLTVTVVDLNNENEVEKQIILG